MNKAAVTAHEMINLLTVPRDEAGVATTRFVGGTSEKLLATARELEKEGYCVLEEPKNPPGSSWSDVYTGNVTQRGGERDFLREHGRGDNAAS